jgi:hypothetical protein
LIQGRGNGVGTAFLWGSLGILLSVSFFVFLHSASDVGSLGCSYLLLLFMACLMNCVLAFIMFFIIIVEFEVR